MALNWGGLTAREYQDEAARTLISNEAAPILGGRDVRLLWNALGLAGETGEVVELIKKGVLHAHGIDETALITELGDVCWYVAALCSVLEIPLAVVMERNLAKLARRYPDGWDAARSRHPAGGGHLE